MCIRQKLSETVLGNHEHSQTMMALHSFNVWNFWWQVKAHCIGRTGSTVVSGFLTLCTRLVPSCRYCIDEMKQTKLWFMHDESKLVANRKITVHTAVSEPMQAFRTPLEHLVKMLIRLTWKKREVTSLQFQRPQTIFLRMCYHPVNIEAVSAKINCPLLWF